MTKVAKKQSNAVATFQVPEGYDVGIQREDVKIPSIILWQKISDLPEFEGENVRAGMFVNPVTGDIYDKGTFEGAVIKYYTTARIYGEVDSNTGRKEVKRYSRDGVHWDDGTLIQPREFQFTEDGSHALKSYHYLVLIKGMEMPAMITFKGASAKFAKSLNANLMYMRPAWRCWFKFSSAVEEKNGNKYHIIQAKAQPKSVLDQENASLCFDLYESLTESTVSSPEMEKTSDFDGDKVEF